MSAKIRFGEKRFTVPGPRPVRMTAGILLIACGLLGFLPILGFWMVPLGLLILSIDLPAVRRFRRRVEVKWGRWRAERRAAREVGESKARLTPAAESPRQRTRQGPPPH